MKTLVIVSHPYPDNSKTIKALESVALNTTGVIVRNLESLYDHDTTGFDIAAEQAAYQDVDRVVFMFPIHWFNLTPMLKAYLNEIWTYGWAFGTEESALKNKEILVITTAGATEATYSDKGLIQSTMEQILTPLKASALYVGMNYLTPISFYEAISPSSERLETFKQKVRDNLIP